MAQEIKNISFLCIVGLFVVMYYVDVQSLPQPEEKNLVNFLVYGIGIFIFVEAIKSIFKAIKHKDGDKNSFSADFKEWMKGKQFILIISIIGYIIVIPIIGFFVTSIIFMITLNYLLESKKIWEVTILPILLLGFIYLLFVLLLNINLPTGILF